MGVVKGRMTYLYGYERNKYLIFGVLIFLFFFCIYVRITPIIALWDILAIAIAVAIVVIGFREMMHLT